MTVAPKGSARSAEPPASEFFFENAPDPMGLLDAEGAYRRVNPAFLAWFGLAEADVLGKKPIDLMHPADRGSSNAEVAAGRGASRYLTRAETVKWLSWNCVARDGWTYAIGRDVTNERLADFREKNDGFRSAAEAMPQIVWTTDAEGVPTYFNRRWYEYTGIDEGELGEQGWAFVVHPDDLALATREWKRVTSSGDTFELEYRLRNGRDGTYRWHLARGVPLRDEGGRIEQWLGTTSDIDYQIRIHKELRQTFIELKNRTEERGELISREKSAQEASRLKSEFLANMSHEIRTPLNGLIGTARILMSTRLTSKQKDLVATLVQSADTLLAIVNDILDLSKIEAGRLDIHMVDFELGAFARGVIRSMVHAAAEKRIQLTLDDDPSTERAFRGDPIRIRQILHNLINNAVKFTRRGGVRLSVRIVADHGNSATVRFEVSDTGIGIANDALERIFESFVQADASTTRRYGGTGLGLAICKRLVGLMGGKIDVQSAVGKGSTFAFEVPLEPRTLSPPSTASFPESDLPIRKGRILVAEDQVVNRKVVRYLLENLGQIVEVVSSGSEAIEAIRKGSFDLVFMDCHMPDMDGYSAVDAIRSDADGRFRDLPVVALTADVLSGTRERCLAAGMNDYVCKPIDVAKLESILRKFLGKETAPSVARSALDAEAIGRLAALGNILGELISDFRRLTPARIAKIRTAARSADFTALEEEAHALKSVAAMLGATDLASACEALETAGRSRKPEGLSEGVARIAVAFESAETALLAWTDAAA